MEEQSYRSSRLPELSGQAQTRSVSDKLLCVLHICTVIDSENLHAQAACLVILKTPFVILAM